MWFSPEQIELMREIQETDLQPSREAAEEAKRKEAENALKTADELILEAKENCRIAGERFSGRILGMLDRESSKMVDQFPVLAEHEEEAKRIIGVNFLIAFDKEIRKRNYVKEALKQKRSDAAKKTKKTKKKEKE